MNAGPADENPLIASFEGALTDLRAQPIATTAEQACLGYEELELDLRWETLHERLAGTAPATWRGAIADIIVETAALARAQDDEWNELKYRVLPVVVHSTAAQQIAERCDDVLAYPYAAVLLITIAVRVDGGLRYLLKSQLEAWGVEGNAAIAAALDNLRRDTPAEAVGKMADDHYALDTADGLDSSRLLILDELLPEGEQTGLLVTVPARDVLSFAPFNSKGYKHIRQLVNLAYKCFRTWPHPICDSLFYIAPRTALHIAVDRADDGTPRLTLPEELAAIHAHLVDSGLW